MVSRVGKRSNSQEFHPHGGQYFHENMKLEELHMIYINLSDDQIELNEKIRSFMNHTAGKRYLK